MTTAQMSAQWITLKACYLAVAACMGVKAPPPPRLKIVPDVPHTTNGKLAHGFPCATICNDPPPTTCTDPKGCLVPPDYCTNTSIGYCAGEYDNPPTQGVVIVSDKTLNAIPHEFIHHFVQKRKLYGKADPADANHLGPWWHCARKEEVPACASLWP